MHTLLKVFEMLDGEEDIVHPSNELIKEGQILKLSAKNGSVQERHVFLFNNMLLYCAPKLRLMGLQKFSVRTRIGIDGMQLHEADTAGQPNTFTVAGKQRSLIVRSRSEAEKEQWIKAIRETLEMHEKNSETFKAFNSSFNREDGCDLPMSELGQRQPKFVRDKSIVECMRCEEAFSALTRRKHHCRACGHVVCGRCSDYKVQLTYDNRLGRVCRNCYTVLHPEPLDGEEEVSIEHGDEIQSNNLICGYLNLVERGTRLSRIWCTIFTKEPLVLYVFETPKDTKPLRTIPLPGYTVVRAEAGEVGDLKHALRLTQSRQTLYIGVENEEAQEQWSKFLSEAAKGNVPEMHGFTACHASDLETEESIVT
uniref:Uncharacterized protein n=1 Tax=Eptatretus burgeri TaxID=7764 RepID=A0A8C4N929_EPTBU